MSNENYLKKLFIDEAKPALQRHSGGGEDVYSKLLKIMFSSTTDNRSYMFDSCSTLTEVPLFDTSNVKHMTGMFSSCSSLKEIPLLDARRVTVTNNMFNQCYELVKVPGIDFRSLVSAVYMFYNCYKLSECWIKNIKTSIQVGSGASYGHLLTVESLIHLIYELRDTGSSNTLTIGTANLEKLANVYVKTIEITDEMKAEDDLVGEKLPFVVCESSDEGAILITDYVGFKNWILA